MTNSSFVFGNVSATYLANYAMQNGISFIGTSALHKDTPSCSDTDKRKIIINLNVSNPNEIPLHMAHEIGHILNKDHGKQYFCLDNKSSPPEVSATKTGIKILADYYFEEIPEDEWNAETFMNYYCIPPSYRDWIYHYLKSGMTLN